MASVPLFVSVREACDVLNRLEGRGLARLGKRWRRDGVTVEQLRYLDASEVLTVTRANGQPSFSRLYGPVDVMMLRLFFRLLTLGVGDARARAAIVYLADDLRRALERPNSDRALLVVGGGRGIIAPADGAYDRDVFAIVNLRDMQTGVREAVEAIRAADPEVWSGRRFESCSSLALAVVND